MQSAIDRIKSDATTAYEANKIKPMCKAYCYDAGPEHGGWHGCLLAAAYITAMNSTPEQADSRCRWSGFYSWASDHYGIEPQKIADLVSGYDGTTRPLLGDETPEDDFYTLGRNLRFDYQPTTVWEL